MSEVDVTVLGRPTQVVEKEGDIIHFWEQPNGYYMKGPHGIFACSGATLQDEIFAHERLGTLNVSKAKAAIAQEGGKRGKYAEKIPVDKTLIDHVAQVDVDLKLVLSMTPERRDEPVVFVSTDEGLHLIDGNHRLKRRIIEGLKFVRGYVLYPYTLEYMRVRWRKWQDGAWVPYDPITAKVLSATE